MARFRYRILEAITYTLDLPRRAFERQRVSLAPDDFIPNRPATAADRDLLWRMVTAGRVPALAKARLRAAEGRQYHTISALALGYMELDTLVTDEVVSFRVTIAHPLEEVEA
jgi:hypothetical protein